MQEFIHQRNEIEEKSKRKAERVIKDPSFLNDLLKSKCKQIKAKLAYKIKKITFYVHIVKAVYTSPACDLIIIINQKDD